MRFFFTFWVARQTQGYINLARLKMCTRHSAFLCSVANARAFPRGRQKVNTACITFSRRDSSLKFYENVKIIECWSYDLLDKCYRWKRADVDAHLCGGMDVYKWAHILGCQARESVRVHGISYFCKAISEAQGMSRVATNKPITTCTSNLAQGTAVLETVFRLRLCLWV